MANFIPLLAILVAGFICAYWRLGLRATSIIVGIALLLGTLFSGASWLALGVTWAIFLAITVPLNLGQFRRMTITKPILGIYRKVTPQLSPTEKIALEAGTVGFEGELFSGMPDWSKLQKQPAAQLSVEEQAFLDGPCEEVLKMNDEWEATHDRADLAPEVWEFLKKHKFFGMIVPREYGGLQFSAYAHSMVLQKLSSVSGLLCSTVAVPNSLGPAELLMHYGTDEQKNHYLPRLANGLDIPCFALTNPHAGSDATSIPDYGIVCHGEHNGEKVLGVKLTFDKRYITLAPVATVIGLAFRFLDPDKLLSEETDRGITLALIPRDTPGLNIGRRHFPMNIPFMNGPLSGKDMFIPLSHLIGGPEYIGQGWRMLVECLSVGRAISLPSNTTGGAKMSAFATGAYARVRKQFGQSIGRFEGIEEALARLGGNAYTMAALSTATASAVDRGEKPSVPSAIAKYHATEMGRQSITDAMDIHGGKAIILGPKNYIGRGWELIPVGITVEGANILTRNMIIFGQGAIRCHPYVLEEMRASFEEDEAVRLKKFDKVLFAHIGFAISNAARAFALGFTGGRLSNAPGDNHTKAMYQKLNRYSACLALVSDFSMLVLGGKLKVKERISARLGDVLSQLYIASSILKRYEDQGQQSADYPLMAYAFHDSIYKLQHALDGVLANFPLRPLAAILQLIVFPWGRTERQPGDRLSHRVAALLLSPSDARDRLCEGVFKTPCKNNPVGNLNAALPKIIAAEPLERKLVKAMKAGSVSGIDFEAQVQGAVAAKVLSAAERDLLLEARRLTIEIISVDDFDASELESAAFRRKPNLKSMAA